ncbi:MAG TPA: gamma-glutamyl-gamma-aminobutyrate hydrolase family protein [Pricia sp.]|nr:gamma-glutamyl-gamma-aminobutyrate hydrolase family protein [Pricia sp.]
MIKIGISSCFMYPDMDRSVFGPKSLSYLENDMANYVTRKGILPVLIPDVDTSCLHDILSEMDGFVLQGGSDLAPETYGESPIGKWKGDAHRDQYELRILDFAITNSVPVFAICRGFQLMNVYFGGTLYQDIATQKPGADIHRSAEFYDTIKHPIHFTNGTFMGKLYGNVKNPKVNTVHHQAIKTLGKNLEIYAVSEDGLIEAFGYTKEPEGKCIGVQWHPEFSHTLKDELISADILYEAFLQHVKDRKNAVV